MKRLTRTQEAVKALLKIDLLAGPFVPDFQSISEVVQSSRSVWMVFWCTVDRHPDSLLKICHLACRLIKTVKPVSEVI